MLLLLLLLLITDICCCCCCCCCKSSLSICSRQEKHFIVIFHPVKNRMLHNKDRLFYYYLLLQNKIEREIKKNIVQSRNISHPLFASNLAEISKNWEREKKTTKITSPIFNNQWFCSSSFHVHWHFIYRKLMTLYLWKNKSYLW